MRLLFPAVSFAIILLLSGAVPYSSGAAVQTSLRLEQPVGTDYPVTQGETIVFTGQLIRADTLGGVPDAPVNIVQQVAFGENKLLASGETDEAGFFSIPWDVDVELVAAETGGSFGGKTTQGRENRFQVVVVARFGGDDQYVKSVSIAQTFEVRLNALAIKVDKKPSYLANESAALTITIRDIDNNLIDPDEMTTWFDGKPITLARPGIGTYVFSVPVLSTGNHLLQIRVAKAGHTPDDELITIEAMKRKTILQISVGKSSYQLGETVDIFISLIDINTQGSIGGRVVSGAVTSPNLAVQQITFVDGMASFALEKFDLTGKWTVSASFAGDASYLPSRATASFEVTKPTGPPIPPPPPGEKVTLSRPTVVDQLGNRLDVISAGQQIMLQAEVASNVDTREEIVYISQVKDSEGITVALSWIKATLSPDQAFDLAVSWIPDVLGEYTAEVFVWKSIKDPQPLVFEPKTLAISVS